MGDSISFGIRKLKIVVPDFVCQLNYFFLAYHIRKSKTTGFIVFQNEIMVPAYLKPSNFKQRPRTYLK